jgi:DNA-binding transcriptional LysR family regulator
VELGRRDADLALRVVRPSQGNLKMRRLGEMTHGVYGHRDYLARHPARDDDPLAGRAVVTWDEAHAHLPAARWLAQRAPDARIALTASTLRAQIAAVRAGLGLAVLPDFLATDPDFVRVLAPDEVFSDGVWLVMHADLAASNRVRAVADFLAEAVAQASGRLAGHCAG